VIKPYYQDDYVTLYHGDCRDILPHLEPVDLVLTDPPYGVTGLSWDEKLDLAAFWLLLQKVGKQGTPYIFTATQPFTSKLVMSNLNWFKHEWIWDKHIPRGFQLAKYRPMMKHESVLVFGNGKVNYFPIMEKRDKPVSTKNYSKNSNDSANRITNNNKDKVFTYTHKNPSSIIVGCWEPQAGKLHPTQKPISLIEYLAKTYSREKDAILDPFAGSGSTLIAARRLSRKTIGIEREQKYCDVIIKRLRQEVLPL
jgi:site-specific DNA-methyltransferase (adenine-specific)